MSVDWRVPASLHNVWDCMARLTYWLKSFKFVFITSSTRVSCFTSCSHILETVVTEREFLEQLHELNHKINFVKEQSFREAKSCQDVKDILDKLKIKVSVHVHIVIH